MSIKSENEIKKIVDKNLEKFIDRINIELNSSNIFSIVKKFKENHEDYLTNVKIFENNTDDFFDYRSFCLVKCYNIKLKLTKKQIDLSYQYEIENKKKIELEYTTITKKLDLLNKILNNLDFYEYDRLYTIKQSRAAPLISFYELFLFLFFISISLVSIFTLFKKSFDEEN